MRLMPFSLWSWVCKLDKSDTRTYACGSQVQLWCVPHYYLGSNNKGYILPGGGQFLRWAVIRSKKIQ